MQLSNSKIKAFLQCQESAYHEYVLKDHTQPPGEAKSRGSLLDAIVTKGMRVTADTIPERGALARMLASTYSDGTDDIDNLLVKNGSFGSKAKTVIKGGNRLMQDPVVKKLLDGAEFQKHIEGKFCGADFKGEIDILTKPIDGVRYLLDCKKTASTEDSWATVYDMDGNLRNQKVPWYDAYDYWMQLTLYKELLKPELKAKEVLKTGILYVTEEEPAGMGIVLIQTDLESLEKIYTPVVKAILDFEAGKVKKLQRCGLCDWCRGTCKVEMPTREMMPTIRYKL